MTVLGGKLKSSDAMLSGPYSEGVHHPMGVYVTDIHHGKLSLPACGLCHRECFT